MRHCRAFFHGGFSGEKEKPEQCSASFTNSGMSMARVRPIIDYVRNVIVHRRGSAQVGDGRGTGHHGFFFLVGVECKPVLNTKVTACVLALDHGGLSFPRGSQELRRGFATLSGGPI